MEFRILGSVDASHDGYPVHLGLPQRRLVAGLLLLEPRRVRPTGALIDALWGDTPPPSARNSLQNAIAALRRPLAAGGVTIVTQPNGYLLDVDPQSVDVHRFAGLVAQGRAAQEVAERLRLLGAAIKLWRGPLLADIGPNRTIASYAAEYEELLLVAHELSAEAHICSGAHDVVIDRLLGLTARHPHRERLTGALMVALGRAGRLAEALQAYRYFWRRVDTELGIRPSAELSHLHEQLLAGDTITAWYGPRPESVARPGPAARPPAGQAAVIVRPAQLPPDITWFTGRTAELTFLDDHLAGPATQPVAIVGPGGSGKTALALRWAHRTIDDFPDGSLYADLHGWSDCAPIEPAAILGRFLRALGHGDIPLDRDEASALYRSIAATRRLLIVLDNASSAEQVRPLLPAGQSTVLITSRDELTGLAARDGVRPLRLGALSTQEASDLLRELVGADRVEAERAAAADIAELCGRLPLAVRIAGSLLSTATATSLTHFAKDLADHNRLSMLELFGDEDHGLRSIFSRSVSNVDAVARRLLWLLAVAPSYDFSIDAAGALGDLDHDSARSGLERLVCASLIQRDGTGRYTIHDLLRIYVRELGDGQDATVALRRLYTLWLRRADTAARLLYPNRMRIRSVWPPDPDFEFADADAALTWLDHESDNLTEAMRHAQSAGLGEYAWRLGDALRGYFGLRPGQVDAYTATAAALTAATDDDDADGICITQLALSEIIGLAGDEAAAEALLRDALKTAEASQWHHAQATTHANLGGSLIDQVRLVEAERHIQLALALDTASSTINAAIAINYGTCLAGLGRLAEAASYLCSAVKSAADARNRQHEVIGLTAWADIERQRGQIEEAVAHAEYSLKISQQLRYASGEAAALCCLSEIHRDLGDLKQALKYAYRATENADDISNRVYAAAATATALTESGLPDEAIAMLRAAPTRVVIPAAHIIDLRQPLADAYLAVGETSAAATQAFRALRYAIKVRAPLLEAAARASLSTIRRDQGDTGSSKLVGV